MSAQGLHAIRQLVALELRAESQGYREDARIDADLNTVRAALSKVPAKALLEVVGRHRLACFLSRAGLTSRLLPNLVPSLQVQARSETVAALALAALTREIAALFARADIPMLVFKGIPLALQTTGNLASRGRGDVDLLVDPRQLPAAVAQLERSGFRRLPGHFPDNLQSAWGRYSRWVGYELPMVRKSRSGMQMIDLHWALSNVRSPLPSFQQAWDSHEQIDISGCPIATLSIRHAFVHACAHAAKDQWMSLRSLIDIDRLGRQLSHETHRSLRRQPAVRWSSAVTAEMTASPFLQALAYPKAHIAAGSRHAMAQAHRAQILPARLGQPGSWTPRHWLTTVWRLAILSRDPRDWLRILLHELIVPAAFSDPTTGEDRNFAGFLQARISRLRERLDKGNARHQDDDVAAP